MERRVIETKFTEEDIRIEGSLRPKTLDEYIGQDKIKETLKIYIDAAKKRKDPWITCCSTGLRVWERPPLRG